MGVVTGLAQLGRECGVRQRFECMEMEGAKFEPSALEKGEFEYTEWDMITKAGGNLGG